MTKMFDMVKQASRMRKEVKRIQSELERRTVDYSNGGVTVVARGDMSLQSVQIAPEILNDIKADKLERLLLHNTNAALKMAKKEGQKMMSGAAQGGGLAELLGGA